jgi:EmrB/QacA subfamily drug resistance transporter
MGGSEVRLATAEGRWIVALTVLGSALVFLDATVVTVALPSMGRALGADVADLQWVVNGYTLTLAALLLTGGTLGDRYRRKRIFLVGVVWFTLASALCALAPTTTFLIGARLFQGIGAALVTPGSLAIIRASFADEDRPRAIGAWSALSGVGAALGPVVGGYLIDAVSWRAIFLLNVPIGIAIVAAGVRHLPESRDERATGGIDVPGAALATIGLAGVTVGLIEAPGRGVGSPLVGAAVVVGVLALAVFALVEHRRENPMLPLDVFTSATFASANAITFVVYAALGGVFFLFAAHLQTTLGYSALRAGAATLPITVLLLVLSSRSGALAQRIGPRWQLTVGPALLAAGTLLMARIDAGDSYVSGILPAVVVFGLGLAAVVAPVTATALGAVEAGRAGLASGVNTAVARVAGLAAVAALPLVAGLSGRDFQRPEALANGFPIAMVAAALLAATGGLVALFTIPRDALEEPRSARRTAPGRRGISRRAARAGTLG